MLKTSAVFSLMLLFSGLLVACGSPAAVTDLPTADATIDATDAPTQAAAEPTDEPTELAPTATDEPTEVPPQGLLTPISDQPILQTRRQFMDPGAVVYHEGTYHIFANVFNGWPARVDIVHGTSGDGVTWEYASQEPILNEEDVPYAELAILATSAVVADDGTWMLYFYTWDNTSQLTTGSIGRATAQSADGPWTADPAPALEAGAAGAWDERRVGSASVVRDDDSGYLMFYATDVLNRESGIGLATSPDGITWTKHDDSATGGAFAESDPVFVPEDAEAWDDAKVSQPSVVRVDDGGSPRYVMLYRAGNQARVSGFGFAFSEDGITWTRYEENPVLDPKIIPNGQAIWFTNLLYADGRLHVFFELGMFGKTRVYIATHEGSTLP